MSQAAEWWCLKAEGCCQFGRRILPDGTADGLGGRTLVPEDVVAESGCAVRLPDLAAQRRACCCCASMYARVS